MLAMLDHVDPRHLRRYLKRGVGQGDDPGWRVKSFESESSLCEAVADRLIEGNIIGWFQGPFEMGPRALGNRSILVRPDDLSAARRLSSLVKDRAAYRPYAFSVTNEDAPEILDLPVDHLRFHRWMQFSVAVRPGARDRVRAAVHVDDTTRPQVCFQADNPRYHALLTAFGERFGCGVLLNTSFNPSGYPLVASPEESLVMFARTDMDALVVNRTLIWKERGSPVA
jgi:carbamoyltransferase